MDRVANKNITIEALRCAHCKIFSSKIELTSLVRAKFIFGAAKMFFRGLAPGKFSIATHSGSLENALFLGNLPSKEEKVHNWLESFAENFENRTSIMNL